MNDTSFHLPWIQFILQLWLEGEATTQDTINLYEKAKSLRKMKFFGMSIVIGFMASSRQTNRYSM